MTNPTPETTGNPISDDEATSEVDGTAAGNPIAGVEIDEAEAEHAVVPDDKPQEVDGPQASGGHA